MRARALCVCAKRVVCASGRCACVQCVCARCVCVRRARMAVHEPVRGARVLIACVRMIVRAIEEQ